MIPILIPVFILTAAMAGGAAYFVGRFVVESASRSGILRGASAALFVGIVFPPVYYGVYRMAKPRDDADPNAVVTVEAALIPAVWVGLLLLGIAFGLWRAAVSRPQPPPPGVRR